VKGKEKGKKKKKGGERPDGFTRPKLEIASLSTWALGRGGIKEGGGKRGKKKVLSFLFGVRIRQTDREKERKKEDREVPSLNSPLPTFTGKKGKKKKEKGGKEEKNRLFCRFMPRRSSADQQEGKKEKGEKEFRPSLTLSLSYRKEKKRKKKKRKKRGGDTTISLLSTSTIGRVEGSRSWRGRGGGKRKKGKEGSSHFCRDPGVSMIEAGGGKGKEKKRKRERKSAANHVYLGGRLPGLEPSEGGKRGKKRRLPTLLPAARQEGQKRGGGGGKKEGKKGKSLVILD